MQVVITIECDNAAFHDGRYSGDELARILHQQASKCRGLQIEDIDGDKLRDVNGNTIGLVKVTN